MERRDKINYYLDIAQVVSERATCLRRNYGAIIVSDDEIISTGYNGAPRGRANCIDLGFCQRERLNIPRGERYEVCRGLHSEANAIISAARSQMLGATLYLCGIEHLNGEYIKNACSCAMCKRMIINAGITTVIIRNTAEQFTTIPVSEWIINDDSLADVFGY